MHEKFQQIISKHSAVAGQNQKISNSVGYIKLAAVLLLIICTAFLFTRNLAAIFAVATVFIACIALFIWHRKLENKINYANGILAICNRQLARLSGEWTKFDDTGQEFIDFEHPYACDLDIVGPKSLFQFLNTTFTHYGRQTFANDLLYPAYSHNQIAERQEAITELSQDIEFANDIQFYFSQINRKPVNVNNATGFELRLGHLAGLSEFIKLFISYMPIATLFVLFFGGIFQITPLITVGIGLVVFQVSFCYIQRKAISEYLNSINNLSFDKYVQVMDILVKRDFSSAKLIHIKSQLASALGAVKNLEKITNKLSVRANPLIYIVFNTLLTWDFYCAVLLERWKVSYSHMTGDWLDVIGEFESLLAFSNLSHVCNNVCMPQNCNGKKINAKNLGHPLLSNEIRVHNDMSFDDNIFIISGSNMSGKTTFMRTVGVNLLLARTGSFVCAKEMTCSVFAIVTSMRIADDLNQGVSTFFAELKRIKMILDITKENPDTIFLIDEIFKGTNSVDRLAGADAVITKLASFNAAGMVSTHDLELCQLAESNKTKIINYSFSEHYKNGNILFDYKMRTGQSKTTNAKFLMEMVGI